MNYSVSDLMPSIRNALQCLDVQSGEEASILRETTTEQVIVDAFASGLRYVGAKVTILEVEPNLMGGLDYARYPKAVEEALLSSDLAVALSTFPLHHTGTGDRLEDGIGLKKGGKQFPLRYLDTIGMSKAEALRTSGRFPTQLFWEIMKRVMRKLSEGKDLRFTDQRGTELTAKIRPQKYSPLAPRTRPMQKSEFLTWPFGAWVTHDMVQCDGLLNWDGCVPFGLFDQPIRLTIEGGLATKIEGGHDAKMLKDYIKGIENSTYIPELGIGLNPWSRRFVGEPNGIHEMTRRSGNCLLAMGAGHIPERFGKSHLDGLFRDQTVYVEDEVFVKDGRVAIFDDPDLREFARQYGDPDTIFSPLGYLYF